MKYINIFRLKFRLIIFSLSYEIIFIYKTITYKIMIYKMVVKNNEFTIIIITIIVDSIFPTFEPKLSLNL